MVLHKIFVKGEIADKYYFIDSLVQAQTLEEIYKFYKELKFDNSEFRLIKSTYCVEKNFFQAILIDLDNNKWKHNYTSLDHVE